MFDFDKMQIIKVFGKTYSIRLSDNHSREDGHLGRSDIKKLEIVICKDMPKEVMEETLLHEIIHQILDQCAIESTEILVSTISTGLYGVLKDNGVVK